MDDPGFLEIHSTNQGSGFVPEPFSLYDKVILSWVFTD
jgi:hypothetical protein